MTEKRLISIENTKFIFQTNFSGDPKRDKFGSDARRVNIIIPDQEQAGELIHAGFNVKITKPNREDEEDFYPVHFVAANINYDSNYPPRIYLVSGDSEPVLLSEDTVGELDYCAISNVNAVLNPYCNVNTGAQSLYVRTMYVEQDVESDPFAARYRKVK